MDLSSDIILALIKEFINAAFKAHDQEELERLITKAATRAVEEYAKTKKSRLWTREEVLQHYRIHPSTLWRWNKSGFLTAVKVGGRCFYTEESLLENADLNKRRADHE